jgi:hypothetical protein
MKIGKTKSDRKSIEDLANSNLGDPHSVFLVNELREKYFKSSRYTEALRIGLAIAEMRINLTPVGAEVVLESPQ